MKNLNANHNYIRDNNIEKKTTKQIRKTIHQFSGFKWLKGDRKFP